jgi:hypothetical protein
MFSMVWLEWNVALLRSGVTDGVQDFTQPNDLNAIACVDKYQASSLELACVGCKITTLSETFA